MATTNDITGDALISKVNSDAYRNNYDLIFSKKKTEEKKEEDESSSSNTDNRE